MAGNDGLGPNATTAYREPACAIRALDQAGPYTQSLLPPVAVPEPAMGLPLIMLGAAAVLVRRHSKPTQLPRAELVDRFGEIVTAFDRRWHRLFSLCAPVNIPQAEGCATECDAVSRVSLMNVDLRDQAPRRVRYLTLPLESRYLKTRVAYETMPL